MESDAGTHFLEKHPTIPKWAKNPVKNAYLLCSQNLVGAFLKFCLKIDQYKETKMA